MNFLKSFFASIWDILKVAVMALVLAGLVRYFLVQPFFVEGASMEPNFESGEYLLIDELSYYFKSIDRGEVVVFHYPLDTSKYYIKRIIGLPGEIVEIKNGKVVVYNDKNPENVILDDWVLTPYYRENNQLNELTTYNNNLVFRDLYQKDTSDFLNRIYKPENLIRKTMFDVKIFIKIILIIMGMALILKYKKMGILTIIIILISCWMLVHVRYSVVNGEKMVGFLVDNFRFVGINLKQGFVNMDLNNVVAQSMLKLKL